MKTGKDLLTLPLPLCGIGRGAIGLWVRGKPFFIEFPERFVIVRRLPAGSQEGRSSHPAALV